MFQYLSYTIIAFFAQLIDAFIGMGFGVILVSLLSFTALSVTTITASVHMAEVFTTIFAGLSHYRFKNFSHDILLSLSTFGTVGALAGVNLSLYFGKTNFIVPAKIITSVIIFFLGLLIVVRFWPLSSGNRTGEEQYSYPHRKKIGAIGFLGALVDAFVGGGWGPITGSLLLNANYHPTKVIGSVVIAEFFITVVISLFFASQPVFLKPTLIISIIIGGLAAAFIGAWFVKKTSTKSLRFLFGIFAMCIAILNILKLFLGLV